MFTDFFILMRAELGLTFMIFLLLFVKLGKEMSNKKLLPIIQTLLLLHFISTFFGQSNGQLFGEMYHSNHLIALQKSILAGALYLLSVLFTTWLLNQKFLSEFFMLACAAVLGMYFLLSSGNLLFFYLSLELATIPVAALANFNLEKRISSEAALKMIFTAAFSSAILLFGISLMYGITGTIQFSALATMPGNNTLSIVAFVFLFSAFAFKLSIVPFHLWTADVYEGSPIPVSAFLSVISKGSFAFVFLFFLYNVFMPLQETGYHLLQVLSIATMITGNLFALRQQNIKRFLAFSSIAQVGFILVAASSYTASATASVTFFIIVYVFSNLTAFAIASLVSQQTGKENIADYKGLHQTNPALSWMMAIALFSLAGVPPTAGFFGKLYLLAAGSSKGHYGLIIVAALNMMLALYYYLRVVKAMFIDTNPQPAEKIVLPATTKTALYFCTAAIILLGLLSWIYEYVAAAIE